MLSTHDSRLDTCILFLDSFALSNNASKICQPPICEPSLEYTFNIQNGKYYCCVIMLIGISSFIALVSLFFTLYTLFSVSSYPPSDIMYPILWSSTFICSTYAHLIRKKSGMVTSGILHLSAVLFALCGGPQFYQNVKQGSSDPLYFSSPLCITYFVWYISILIYTFLMCFADPRDPTQQKQGSVELDCSFLNRLTLWWFNPIPWKGSRKDLKAIEDLFNLNEGSTTKYLSDLWEKHWNPRLEKYHRNVNQYASSQKRAEPKIPSIVSCLFEMFRWEFLTASFLKAISDTLQFANPFLLHELIGFVSDPKAPFSVGLSYSVLMFIASETLKLCNSARKDKTVGEIVNLMAIDVERFQMITPQIQQFWSCPYQVEQMRLKDERTKMVNELLNGIKVVKLYAWEVPMEELINDIRIKELKLLKKSYIVRNIIDSFNTSGPFLVALFSFGTYVLSSHRLTPQILGGICVSNTIQSTSLSHEHDSVAHKSTRAGLQAVVSNKRLKEYLTAKELDSLVFHSEMQSNGKRL
ncbi:hypothetical protein DICVIV_04524 [Dictyocaulus viviparus]|uniref:ABC transmembrane type-1 domain-containing protein n=1 Tax=Dictyocaulus viviparus TaxID=29172 RepID=A0A0D8Y435_DICVI|nr:hypothetical protein DICVIV_04524 [Dictyocaulus viviparus]